MDNQKTLFSVFRDDDRTGLVVHVHNIEDRASIAMSICGYMVRDELFASILLTAIESLTNNPEFIKDTNENSFEASDFDWNEYLKTLPNNPTKS